jgi:hypothetical protein
MNRNLVRHAQWPNQNLNTDPLRQLFDRMFEAISSAPDLEWLMIDATVIRAQAQAAGARRKRGDLKPRLSAARVAGSAPNSMPS